MAGMLVTTALINHKFRTSRFGEALPKERGFAP